MPLPHELPLGRERGSREGKPGAEDDGGAPSSQAPTNPHAIVRGERERGQASRRNEGESETELQTLATRHRSSDHRGYQ